MIDNPSIADHTPAMRILASFSVNEIFLPRKAYCIKSLPDYKKKYLVSSHHSQKKSRISFSFLNQGSRKGPERGTETCRQDCISQRLRKTLFLKTNKHLELERGDKNNELLNTHTHTRAYTPIYIYIYIEREREREREKEKARESEEKKWKNGKRWFIFRDAFLASLAFIEFCKTV